jgi:hypothetical protein
MNGRFDSVGKMVIIGFLALLFTLTCKVPADCADKWPGVDETVVEKYAKEHGREAREPLLNTDQGDLLLFVFLLAGALGGFAGGYCWRMLVTENKVPSGKPGDEEGTDA